MPLNFLLVLPLLFAQNTATGPAPAIAPAASPAPLPATAPAAAAGAGAGEAVVPAGGVGIGGAGGAAAGAGGGAGAGADFGTSPLTLGLYALVFILWFYLLVIRPQQRQEKARKALISAVKKNDKVMTSAGIYGTVMSIDNDNDKVVVRIDDDKGVKVTFNRASIVQVLTVADEKGLGASKAAAESKS